MKNSKKKSPTASSAPRKPSRPVVIANFAVTWDGEISTRNGTPSDFSSKRDKRRLLEIRSLGDALLVGRRTVERENMAMGMPAEDLRQARLQRGQPRYPIRVIISNRGDIDPNLKLFRLTFSPVLIFSTQAMKPDLRKKLAAKATLHLSDRPRVDLREVLTLLRNKYRVKRLVCEGGPALLRSLLDEDLVDEIYLTFCPLIFGGEKALTLTGLPGDFLPRSLRFKLASLQLIETEAFAHYKIVRNPPPSA